jgi:hypothetical protein
MAESYQRKHSRGDQGKEFFGDRAPISAPVRTASRDSSVVCVGMYPVHRLFQYSFWEDLLSENASL